MKLGTTTASDMYSQSHRLDASYHASEGGEALRFIRRWADRLQQISQTNSLTIKEERVAYNALSIDRLQDVCIPNGVYIPSRFKRIFVDSEVYGALYITGGDLLKTDPKRGAKYLSYRFTANLDELAFCERMILVTCSGTIGKTAYVNANFNGTVGSPDLLRIVADEKKIMPGYLYALIRSDIGRALIQQKTYGAVVQHIEAHHVIDLPIPRLARAIEAQIHTLVEQASALRVKASNDLLSVQHDICEFLGLPTKFKTSHDHSFSVGVSHITDKEHYRLDAFHFIGYVGEALAAIQSTNLPTRKLSEVTLEIFNAPIFKRIYVNSEGLPYLMGYEVYENNPSPTRFISRNTKDLDRYVLREGMIIVQDSGSRYGLLGTPVYANRTLDGNAATNNMIRIVSPNKQIAGYLYAFLSTEIGQRLIIRESYGSTIPHIFPSWLGDIPVPWPDEDVRNKFSNQVITAFECRAQADELEDETQAILLDALGWQARER